MLKWLRNTAVLAALAVLAVVALKVAQPWLDPAAVEAPEE